MCQVISNDTLYYSITKLKINKRLKKDQRIYILQAKIEKGDYVRVGLRTLEYS